MIKAERVKRKGEWQGAGALKVALTFQDRHRRRMSMQATDGTAFLLDLPRATTLRHGDALVLDDGRLVAVEAAPEPVLEMTCADSSLLVRLAWHLGNRHLPTQMNGNALTVLEDHVIADMARGLGAEVRHCEKPFDPEGGAYESHGHSHNHG